MHNPNMGTRGLALLAISCLGVVILCGGGSIEDDMEMEERLRILNKPAVITFERGGSIIDCVDFYKQPAFDNPLLKNHSIPKGAGEIMSTRSKAKQMVGVNRTEGFEGCPAGTVPIRRVTRQDLLREKSLHNLHLDFVDPSFSNNPSYHAAYLRLFESNILGMRASVGIHSPRCEGNQMTGSFVQLLGTSDGSTDNIYAGWAIYPQLYGGDVKTHITIYWSNRARGKGCFNTQCPGFVQVHAKVMPGYYFVHTSVYDGDQYEARVEIHQDVQTKHWWFIMDSKKIGYWPKELFSNLDGGAENALVGGIAISDNKNVAPQMGYGNYPSDMISEAGYVRHIEFSNSTKDAYDPISSLGEQIHTKNCFGLSDLGIGKSNGYTILFGGPGGGKCR